MTDVIGCAVCELSRKPLRSLLTMSGYLFGSFFIFVVALTLHFEFDSKAQVIDYMGTRFIAFAPADYQADNFVASGPWPIDAANESFFADPMVVTTLLPVSIAEKIDAIEEVTAATPFLLFRFKAPDGHMFSLGGLNPEDETALRGTATTKRDIIAGAFPSSGDRGVVLVEESYAAFWHLEVGSVVNIAGTLFPVIGIVRHGVRPVRADLYMNWADAEEVINKRLTEPLNQQANIFLVESDGIYNHEIAMEKVEQLFPSGLINTFPCVLPGVLVMGMSEKALSLVLTFVFIIVLLFAANSAWASVIERRRDIAVLKALGWKNSVILRQIMIESLILALMGSSIGLVAGKIASVYIAPAISSVIEISMFSTASMVIAALIMVLFAVCAIIASALPAIKANRMNPADLLRDSYT